MANEEHVAALKQGREAWRRWDETYDSDPDVDFSRADFSGADFSGYDLSNLDLGAVDFGSANLSRASLFQAYLVGTNFSAANLRHADLSGALLGGSPLIDADLRDANLTETGLEHTDLQGANLAGANLSKARLQCANLTEANLSGADFTDAEYDSETIWPGEFRPPPEARKVERDSKRARKPTLLPPDVAERASNPPSTSKFPRWLSGLGKVILVEGDEVVWSCSSSEERYIATVIDGDPKAMKIQLKGKLLEYSPTGSISMEMLASQDRITFQVGREEIDLFLYHFNQRGITAKDMAFFLASILGIILGVTIGGGFPLIASIQQTNIVLQLLIAVIFMIFLGGFLSTLGSVRAKIENRSKLSLQDYWEDLKVHTLLSGAIAFVVGIVFIPPNYLIYYLEGQQIDDFSYIVIWAVVGAIIGFVVALLFYYPHLEFEMRGDPPPKK
jgi:hypothetical protein